MRFLAGGIFGLLMLWAGYWFVGQRMIEGRIAEELEQLPSGVQIAQEGFNVSGFPSRFDLTVTRPQVRLASGWGFSAEFAQVFAMTWKPWQMIGALPHSVTIETPQGQVALNSARFMASLRLGTAADLPFEEAVIEVEGGELQLILGPSVTAEKLILALKHEGTPGFAYRLGVQVTQLSPLVAAPSGGNLTWRLDAVIHSSAALDRLAGARMPQVSGIDLKALSLDWGAVKATGAGDLVRTEEGCAEGEIALKVASWRDLPAALADFALVRPEIVPVFVRALEVLASEQGDPKVLDLPLRFKGGLSYLGPLPIGPAPMLAQRQ